MDARVEQVQNWLNSTYGSNSGFERVEVNGKTGWPTIHALTRALQIELGITPTSDSFGPTTTAKCPTVTIGYSNSNIVKIVQSALYCKGYDPNGIDGVYGTGVKVAVSRMQSDANLAVQNGVVTPAIFKALLSMNAFVTVPNGDSRVREIQRALNGRYERFTGISPCDGVYSAATNKALIYALQVTNEVAGANGVFGPGTKAACPVLRSGITSENVRNLQYALYVNGYDSGLFDGVFGAGVTSQVKAFQSFVGLLSDGIVGMQTWASLLVSRGDDTRLGTACDGITTITSARAKTLIAAGYKIVGRYLTNAKKGTLDKKIKVGELQTIFDNGLSVFPIFQTDGGRASYFSSSQGVTDAKEALNAASAFGFKHGTTIYFAVDFDAMDGEVTSAIMPYFTAVRSTMRLLGDPYKVGSYGPRNVCSRLFEKGLTTTSFVCDMSTGFSGNLGYPLPRNWAFDQISTRTIGSGSGLIEIDNNIASGRDLGQQSIEHGGPTSLDRLDARLPAAKRPELAEDLAVLLNQMTQFIPKAKRVRPFIADSTDIVLDNDELFTQLARSYGMRKSLIQAVYMWETSVEGVEDRVVDASVRESHQYRLASQMWEELPLWQQALTPIPKPPLLYKTDASTGCGQIFAATAIAAINFGVSNGLRTGSKFDATNLDDIWAIWQQLNEDMDFNISMCALTLLWGANDVFGIVGDPLQYSEAETQSVLARYNGKGSVAQNYGKDVYGIYSIFEKYNSQARG